jgi:hypothetical protein
MEMMLCLMHGNLRKLFDAVSSRSTRMKPSPGLRLILKSVLLCSVPVLASSTAFAQVTSNSASVSLTATLNEILSISATPSAVTFTLAQGTTATGSSPVAIQTTWLVLPTRANLILDGYFASAAAALTDGATTPDNIPTSAVLGEVPTGTPTTFTAFTQSTALGPTGAGLTLFTLPLTATNRAGTRTDNLSLEINLSSLPQLPAGTYTGTLTLQAQAL